MELEVTWKRTLRIWWSYFWRNLIALILGFIGGAIIGAVLGFALGMAGVPPTTIRLIVMPIGFVLGLLISVFPLYFILGKDFGEFRLVLLAKDPPVIAIPTPETSAEPSGSSVPPA